MTGLVEGQWYAYRIRAINKLGDSRPCRATDEIQAVDARGGTAMNGNKIALDRMGNQVLGGCIIFKWELVTGLDGKETSQHYSLLKQTLKDLSGTRLLFSLRLISDVRGLENMYKGVKWDLRKS